MSVYPTNGANVARCDLELVPPHPRDAVFTWEAPLAPPEHPVINIGKSTFAGTVEGQRATFHLPAETAVLIGLEWTLVDSDTGEAILRGTVVRWDGGAGPAEPGTVRIAPGAGTTVVVRSVMGEQGPPGGQATVGLLADRPAAAEVSAGAMFFAADDSGGTMWIEQAGAWVRVGPSVNEATAGQLLTAVWPLAIAPLAHPGTPNVLEIPELVSAPFVWPAGGAVVHLPRSVIFVTGGTTAGAVNWAIGHRAGAGAWSTQQFSPALEASGAATLNMPADTCYLAPQLYAPGTLVQVRLGIHYGTSGRTFQPVANPLFLRWAGFVVVAG